MFKQFLCQTIYFLHLLNAHYLSCYINCIIVTNDTKLIKSLCNILIFTNSNYKLFINSNYKLFIN